MLHNHVQSFLAICRYKTLTAAAQKLYINQSSLSLRLRALEETVGSPLFYRKKGQRELSLTPAGSRFYELALRYERLVNHMEHLDAEHPTELKISSLNTLGVCLLPKVYQRFLNKFPNVRLELQDMTAGRAYESMLHRVTDLAFITAPYNKPGALTSPIFSEPIVLVCSGGVPLSPREWSDLSPDNEVYVPWSPHFARWHQQTFSPEEQPRFRATITEDLRFFLSQENVWAFLPISVADWLEPQISISRCTAPGPLPTREVFSVQPDTEAANPAIEAFLVCLHEVLSANPALELKF